jgi:tetratricopeptide (TPR) repeat protein
MRRPLLALAVLLAGGLAADVAHAKPKTAKPKTAAVAAAPARGFDFQPADDALAASKWADAADAVTPALDHASAEVRAGAWWRLGRALEGQGLRYAALLAWAEGVRAAPAVVAPDYPSLLEGAEALHEERWLAGIAGNDFSVPIDEATRARLALVTARALVAEDGWGRANGLLALVPASSPEALEADVLRGVALASTGRYEEAIERLLAAREKAAGRSEHFRAVLDLDLARAYYGAKNYGRAIEFFAKVPASDPMWPEAYFERAWAHFMADDPNGSLGILMTHSSPFLEGLWFPEAEMLQAQSMYVMCKFPAAVDAIAAFAKHYETAVPALRDVSTRAPETVWADTLKALDGAKVGLPERYVALLATQGRIANVRSALTTLEGERTKLTRLSGAWVPRIDALITQRAAERAREEGATLAAQMTTAAESVQNMLLDVQLAEVDLLTYRAQMLERAAATGKPVDVAVPQRKSSRKDAKKRGDKMIWPFEGEYWADEVGWYRVRTTPECPKEMADRMGVGTGG